MNEAVDGAQLPSSSRLTMPGDSRLVRDGARAGGAGRRPTPSCRPTPGKSFAQQVARPPKRRLPRPTCRTRRSSFASPATSAVTSQSRCDGDASAPIAASTHADGVTVDWSRDGSRHACQHPAASSLPDSAMRLYNTLTRQEEEFAPSARRHGAHVHVRPHGLRARAHRQLPHVRQHGRAAPRR